MSILVTGARGNIGKEVLSALVKAGEDVRASSRNPQPGDFPDGVDLVRADLEEPESFSRLFSGVKQVFLYAKAETAEELATAAAAAGVEHIVLLSSHSVMLPAPEKNPIAFMHLKVEQALQASGVDWTFVRPGYLATNTLRWSSIRTEGVLRTAFPDGGGSLVHERDVAELAVQAMTGGTERRQSYLVPGAGRITIREQVAAIAETLGQPVRLEVVDIAQYRSELTQQLPEHLADRLIQLRGEIPQVPDAALLDVVPKVLGRPSLSFATWAKDHAADFRES